MQSLYRFLAEKNPDAARRAASAIRDGMQIAADHSTVGRPVEDMDPEFQEIAYQLWGQWLSRALSFAEGHGLGRCSAAPKRS